MGIGFLRDHQRTNITDEVRKLTDPKLINQEIDIKKLILLIDNNRDNDYQFILNQEEAARCLRKKLKYGRLEQQLLALEILNKTIISHYVLRDLFNDEKLIDRLLIIALNKNIDGNGKSYNKILIRKCQNYVSDWYNFIIGSLTVREKNCYVGLVNLYKNLRSAKTKKVNNDAMDDDEKYSNKNMIFNTRGDGSRKSFMNDSADQTILINPQNGINGDPDKKYRIPKINLKKETSRIKIVISDSMTAVTSLKNSLAVLPKGVSAMHDKSATENFIKARNIRRKVLRYLQLVTEGELLSSLLLVNDELVKALTEFDSSCNNSTDYDDNDNYSSDDYYRSSSDTENESVTIIQSSSRNVLVDPSDPFGDQNVV